MMTGHFTGKAQFVFGFRQFYCSAIVIFSLIFPSSAHSNPPIPQKKDDLARIENLLETGRKEKAQLERKAIATRNQIEQLQKQLVTLGQEIQSNERDLSLIESELSRLMKLEAHLNSVMEDNRAALGELVSGLQRIARIPPEAMILRPGSPVDNARSAMLMESALQHVNKQVSELRKQLKELEETRRQLSEQRHIAEKVQISLVSKQERLGELFSLRKSFLKRTENQKQQKEIEVRELARKARDIEDLIARLNAQKRKENEQKQVKKSKKLAALTPAPPALRPPGVADDFVPQPRQKPLKQSNTKNATEMPSDNGARYMPVAGDLIISYGKKDLLGAKSRGITLSGRPGATVVSPMSGIVRFAGPFRHFQHILIIEHPGGYHSLIAGLARINAEVGQQVAAGEPVGFLGKPPQWDTKLYYELRSNGQPIDPAPVIAVNKS